MSYKRVLLIRLAVMEADRRIRRTRAQLRAAVLRLLGDGAPLSMAAIAAAADVNRSTVHQHYRGVDDLICDALADRLRAIAGELADCPFTEQRERPPRQLVTLVGAVREVEPTLRRLGPSGRARIERELTEALTEVLTEQFRAGRRPPGRDRVSPELHARYVAAGVVALALHAAEAETPGRIAGQAWRLIR